MRHLVTKTLSTVLALSFVTGSALAQEATTCHAPNHDRALKVVAAGDELMQFVTKRVHSLKSLATARSTVEGMASGNAKLECDAPALSPKELATVRAYEARAAKWAVDEAAVLDAEEKAREEIIVPLCQSLWERDNARALIAHERGNPSGVVNLHDLHVAGEDIQNTEASIRALKPLYAAFRHHAFTTWQSEGACVAASEASE